MKDITKYEKMSPRAYSYLVSLVDMTASHVVKEGKKGWAASPPNLSFPHLFLEYAVMSTEACEACGMETSLLGLNNP